jgi:hypothetical protein
MMKTVSGKVTLCYPSSHMSGRTCEIHIQDASTGLLIAKAELQPEDFFAMMSGLSCTPCKVDAFDTFGKLGKKTEYCRKTISDERLANYKAEFKEIIEDHRAELETDGWLIQFEPRNSMSLSQGQHKTQDRTLWVSMVRYSEVEE